MITRSFSTTPADDNISKKRKTECEKYRDRKSSNENYDASGNGLDLR